MEYYDYLLILLFGAAGAFLSGFLGVGGGMVYIPVADYFLSKSGMSGDMLVKGILANSLFTIFFSGSLGSYQQYKSGNFFPKQIIQTGLPGMLAALLTAWLIKNGTWYSKPFFNYIFASMLLLIVTRMALAKKSNQTITDKEKAPWQYGLTGFFAGIVTSMSGLGGGVVMTPVFTDLMHQPIKKATSISSGVIPIFALALGIYNLSDTPAYFVSPWQIGYIVFPVVLPLIASTFVMAPLGVRVAQRTNPMLIRVVFATFALLMLSKLLYEIYTH